MDMEDAGVELKMPEGDIEEASSYSTYLILLFQMVQDHWLGSFCLNLLGYALIILPAALLIRRWKKDPQVKAGHGPLNSLLKLLVFGDVDGESPESKAEAGKAPSPAGGASSPTNQNSELSTVQYVGRLIVCIAGLQGAYLTWGVLQERVVTRTYNGEQFTNSQFLVFVNRILALAVAGLYLLLFPRRDPVRRPPFYKYSYSSISNTLSSWCQYEALKFVSFPTQVLAKASKVIPVMLMGKVVSNRTYPWHEYFTATLLSMGVGMFLLAANPAASDEDHARSTTETTFAGVVILLGYMAFDSFTSNWQSELFRTYRISSVQMMFGVNLFSCVFTMGSLLFRGAFFPALFFLFSHAEFAFHAAILSICSAVGQLFIFNTIAIFGPIVFTLIMTTRQAISILLSCLIYGHLLTMQALLGVLVVFVALFLRVYFKSTNKK